MFEKPKSSRKGFTLVEIMIVVALIVLIAAIALPNFLRARKRSQASRMLEDLRLLDAALDQYTIQNNKQSGSTANFSDLRVFIKQGSVLYNANNKDLYGNDYNDGDIYTVDGTPKVNAATFDSLSDVVAPDFWSPYH
jgi:prepilin-type N-terminal cleavage/methylation domain-containing protein